VNSPGAGRVLSPARIRRSPQEAHQTYRSFLDNFTELNDGLGHAQGDQALRDTAERIRATLRAGDVVARLGGDQFVALLTTRPAPAPWPRSIGCAR
jgi:diguanylate cyclase (GGDEF)-like protein